MARVACIGDSMLYGFGGPGRHSFPHHLFRVLNAAYPEKLIFTDNFGQTSGNLWNSWPLLKALATSRRFDAVVFSMCHNDLELFSSNGVSFDNDRLKTFMEGSPTWAAGSDMFAEIASWCDERSIDVLIIFYTFHPGDRAMIDRVAARCSELNLPFVDVLDFFQRETALTVATYAVSEFDGHPSNMAHELAARRVAREFIKCQFLAAAASAVGNVEARMVTAIRSMIDQGMASDIVLQWAFEVSEVKEIRLRRQVGNSTSPSRSAEWGTFAGSVKQMLTAWRNSLRRQVREQTIFGVAMGEANYLPNLAGHRRNFEELLYVLLNASPSTDLAKVFALFECAALGRNNKLPDFDGNLADAAAKGRAAIDAAKRLMALADSSGLVKGILPIDGALPVGCEAGLNSSLAHEIELLDRQIELLETYANCHPRGLRPETPEFGLCAILLVSLTHALVYVDRLTHAADQALSFDRPLGLPWTIVTVDVEGPGGSPPPEGSSFDLVVDLHYELPKRGIIRDRQLAGAVKERATYRFEFPLMLAGNVFVGLHESGVNRSLFTSGKTRFSRIVIGNADWSMHVPEQGKSVVWVSTGEKLAGIVLKADLS